MFVLWGNLRRVSVFAFLALFQGLKFLIFTHFLARICDVQSLTMPPQNPSANLGFRGVLEPLCSLEIQGGLSLGHRVCLAPDDVPGDQGSRDRRSVRPWRDASTGESRVGGLGGQDTPREMCKLHCV